MDIAEQSDRDMFATIQEQQKEINQLKAQVERLRLERDMLALNRGKESQVFVVMDSGSVSCVAWPKSQSATQQLLNFPVWYTDQETADET
jgi:hypothetical protein